MKNPLPLSEEMKLTVTYRVEPGCLGADGEKYIVAFCDYAQKNIQSLDSDYIVWNIVPRNDKGLPEMQYNVVGKSMSHSQAEKYLAIIGKSLDEFECHLGDKFSMFIDDFMRHSS